ncbi:unnamed protein product [marine sediment metagenome]|uniref:Uncharacterized protein n=1 Tax=marine sediment metagenome TaxID=412755 RepID=X1R2B9_9ZZZZ
MSRVSKAEGLGAGVLRGAHAERLHSQEKPQGLAVRNNYAPIQRQLLRDIYCVDPPPLDYPPET